MATTLAGWTQYGADGPEARLVVDEAACPSLDADGQTIAMQERFRPTEIFPGRVCVAPIPAGAHNLNAGGLALPAPNPAPKRIALFGDTGCRLKEKTVQSCNDPKDWPFKQIAERIASKEHPDLVIHVGDMLYREAPCEAGDSRCAGSPWGDNWFTWDADFFAPGFKLLAAAPWLIQRGNHEDCKRGGKGWTAMLGRAPADAACTAHEPPMIADLGGIKVALLDDNDAPEDQAPPAIVAALKQDIGAVMAKGADWILTHHPMHGVNHAPKAPGEPVTGSDAALDAAIEGVDQQPLSLLLSGHIHNFQILNYGSSLAPQMVVGEGGDLLDPDVPAKLTGLVTGGQTVADGLSIAGFGYVMMERIGDSRDWKITVHAVDGAVLRNCALKSRKLNCG